MNEQPQEAVAAQSAVEMLRLKEASVEALAGALLDLSHALDREERNGEAGDAVREGIETLTPAFLADPSPLALPMRALIAQYLSLAGRGGCDLDPLLILPVAAELGALKAAESGDEAGEIGSAPTVNKDA